MSHAKSDHLGRKIFDELQLGKGLMNRTFTYHEGVITQAHLDNDKQVSKPETALVKQIEFADGRTIQYEYDAEERITQVIDTIDGVETKTEYTYDELGQLLTEKKNNVIVNTMTYDNYGNIKTKNGKTYTYDSTWRDKLLSTGDGSIGNYDANGNPRSYLGNTLVWEKGRQLKAFGTNSYKYNNDGIRIKKTTSSEIHDYILDGTNIVKEIVTDICNCPKYTNEYLYDLDGTVCGLKYNGTAYYFYKNLQGDVIAITDDAGATVARYTYDAWGKCTIVSDNSGVGIATINPFRYRGYYYDEEIALYYLQSRYYDVCIGRFINADSIDFVINRAQCDTCSENLYSYCANNPIMITDPSGAALISIAIIVIALLLAGVVGGIIKVKALQDTESYKKTIGGGQFLQSAITFLLGFFQVIYTIFFMALLGCWIVSLAFATGKAIKEFVKCKNKFKPSVFAAFIDGLTEGLTTHIIGKIINAAIKSKNLRSFVETLIGELG